MSIENEDGPWFEWNDRSGPVTIMGLTAALQSAVRFAVFREGVEVDPIAARATLDRMTQELLREIKNVSTQGISETDETTGFTIALSIVEETAKRIARTI